MTVRFVVSENSDKTAPPAEKELLRAKVDRTQNITPDERRWYYGVLDNENLDWDDRKEKVEFYLRAAMHRTRITEMAPPEHREQIYKRVKAMLDSSLQRQLKGAKLEEMQEALNAFWGVQNLIQDQARRLHFLPEGFESRIWGRFQTMYLASGHDIASLQDVKAFEASITRTLHHLAKIGEQQEALRTQLRSRPRFLMILDEVSGKSMREIVAEQFEHQLYHWLDNAVSLREWSSRFGDFVERQMPQQIKAFNQTYRQVYSETFWKLQEDFSPQDFPVFASSFNFRRETDFLHAMSIPGIKKKTKEVHGALVDDTHEWLTSSFSLADRKRWKQKIKATKPSQLVTVMRYLQEIKTQREVHEREAKKALAAVRTLERRRFIMEGAQALEEMEKQYGERIFEDLNGVTFVEELRQKNDRIKQLQKELKQTKSVEQKEEIQAQLLELEATFYFPDDGPGAREHKISQLEAQFELYLASNHFSGAQKVVSKLKKYDAVASYELYKKLEVAQSEVHTKGETVQETSLSGEDEEKVSASYEKITKQRFFEKCIEHAEKVKESCAEIGIPTDDEDFWGADGIRNRVQWLKEKGLYSAYQRYHASDPNVPKVEGNGGFRFRWLDGRGADHLTLAKAEDGIKYLNRYKESGYHLCALAGAFSVNWRSSSDETYCPDDFIDAIREEMTSL